MSLLGWSHTGWRRQLWGPTGATGALLALTPIGLVAGVTTGSPGWLLAWLLLGLTAGYALSGSV